MYACTSRTVVHVCVLVSALKISLGNKNRGSRLEIDVVAADIDQLFAHQKVFVSNFRIRRIHESEVSTCVCVCRSVNC